MKMSGSRVTPGLGLKQLLLFPLRATFPVCITEVATEKSSLMTNHQPTGTPRLPSPAVQRFPAVQKEERGVGGSWPPQQHLHQ